MSKFKLADTLNISIDDADMIIKNYFKATPALNKYLESCRRYGVKNGFIRSFKPYSIIRHFPQFQEYKKTHNQKLIGEIERCSMNTPIQSSGAQMMKRAISNIRKYIKTNNLQEKVLMVMTVHDQLDCEVVNEFAEEWSIVQKGIQEAAGEEMITGLPVISDVIISDVWKK
jgi:DNA polymerase-1